MRTVLNESHIHPQALKTITSFHHQAVQEVAQAVAKNEWVIVGMAHNPFVIKARRLLDEKRITYTYLEYGSYFSQWKTRLAIKLWSGWSTYPQVFHKGVLIGGFNDLKTYHTTLS
jgi:monothiol glutaredoxin